MKKVMFVDDEENILSGLRRLLRPMREEWDMEFVNDPLEAMRLLEAGDYDVVVSDMRMPQATGVEVLTQAKECCPQAVRIGLSGYADAELALEAAQVTHQFLAKPCQCEQIVGAVERVVRLQHQLNNADLQRAIGSVKALPSLPHLYQEIMQEASSPEGTLARVGEIIGQDLGMTTKVLQLVNSAFFGLSATVTTPAQAASVLGLDAVRSLVLGVGLFEQFKGASCAQQVQELWSHSVRTAAVARNVARHFGCDDKVVEQALLAGMIHDIGKLIVMTEFSRVSGMITALIDTLGVSVVDAERQLLGCDHQDVGAYLLTLWGFPSLVVEAVAFHEEPGASTTSSDVLTAVHVANAIDTAARGGHPLDSLINEDYLDFAGRRSIAGVCEQLLAAAEGVG